MNEKEAREVVIQGSPFKLKEGKAYTLLELIDKSIERNSKFYYAKGYLEAIEKVGVLVELLRSVHGWLSTYAMQTHSRVALKDIKKIDKSLAKWEKMK